MTTGGVRDMMENTHFGFKEVPVDEKSERVAQVFHSVSQHYDLMNDLMSFGIHRLWKRFAVDLASLRPGEKVLDLASGTADLAIRMAKCVGENGEILVTDINPSMLEIARRRMVDAGLISNIHYMLVNAEQLPFSDNSFDCLTISFGLRNVTHIDKALNEMRRVIRPGGRALVLEFSKPRSEAFQKIYDSYSFNVLPLLGKYVAKDEESYRYLAESIRMHPDQDTLKNKMTDAGFDQVDVHNLTGGVVAIHRGYKW